MSRKILVNVPSDSCNALMGSAGNYIRELRLRKGLSQPAIAQKSGVSVKTLQRAEADEGVSRYTLKDIIEALGQTLDQLDTAVEVEGESSIPIASAPSPSLPTAERLREASDDQLNQLIADAQKVLRERAKPGDDAAGGPMKIERAKPPFVPGMVTGSTLNQSKAASTDESDTRSVDEVKQEHAKRKKKG